GEIGAVGSGAVEQARALPCRRRWKAEQIEDGRVQVHMSSHGVAMSTRAKELGIPQDARNVDAFLVKGCTVKHPRVGEPESFSVIAGDDYKRGFLQMMLA